MRTIPMRVVRPGINLREHIPIPGDSDGRLPYSADLLEAFLGQRRACRMNLKSERGPDGPHKLPYNEQSRCVVKGQRLDGGACTVVLIRDRAKRACACYPLRAPG